MAVRIYSAMNHTWLQESTDPQVVDFGPWFYGAAEFPSIQAAAEFAAARGMDNDASLYFLDDGDDPLPDERALIVGDGTPMGGRPL